LEGALFLIVLHDAIFLASVREMQVSRNLLTAPMSRRSRLNFFNIRTFCNLSEFASMYFTRLYLIFDHLFIFLLGLYSSSTPPSHQVPDHVSCPRHSLDDSSHMFSTPSFDEFILLTPIFSLSIIQAIWSHKSGGCTRRKTRK
jgi:hypothetical protein